MNAVIFSRRHHFRLPGLPAVHRAPALHRGRHLADPGGLRGHPRRGAVHVHVPRLCAVLFARGRREAGVAEGRSISRVSRTS